MARTQFTFTFTNAQAGADVTFSAPVYANASTKVQDGPRLVLDSSNAVSVWADAAHLVATTIDGLGLTLSATATTATPSVTDADGTAGPAPSGGSVAVVTQAEITVTEVATAAHAITASITAVDTVGKSFTVAGDKSHLFVPGLTITVTGSTGNDGTYTLLLSGLDGSGNTLVNVNEVVADATGDGTIHATLGLYQGTLALPANSAVQEVVGYLTGAPWAASLAILSVGDDVSRSAGYIGSYDLLTNVDLYVGATGGGGTSPTWSSDTGAYSSDWHNWGVRYPSGANVLVTVVTQIASPPATPTGSLIVGIRYVTGVVPVAATATVT